MSVTIWHNPRCSKSRMTLQLLEERGVEPIVRLYLEDVPSAKEIKVALAALEMSPLAFMRKGEDVFKSLNLGADTVGDVDRVSAMVKHPILIERPVVFSGDKARIGRPPEQVLEIL